MLDKSIYDASKVTKVIPKADSVMLGGGVGGWVLLHAAERYWEDGLGIGA
jgi:2-phospho-L-lactate transferase/gluconeogenesis factor (CofD/UPF0052 family)